MCVRVRAGIVSDLLGKCGTVIERVSPGERTVIQGVHYREAPSVGWVVSLDNYAAVTFEELGKLKLSILLFREDHLIRIDGDAEEEEESEADEVSKISPLMKGAV